MNGSRGVFLCLALTTLVACPKKDSEDEQPNVTPPPPPPTAAATVDIKPQEPAAPTIPARVKAELDNRVDGVTGAPLAVTGARASMQVPQGWTTTKGDVTTSANANKAAQLAATALAASDTPTSKLPAVAGAIGLTDCTWNPPESVTLGKSKLAATAADGACKKGGTPVPAAYVSPLAEGLLVVGTWDPGTDAASVFGSMRSITKAGGGGGDASGIAACCAALRQNAKSAPPEQQGAYLFAASACDALRNDPQGRAALGQVRAALKGASLPASCK